MKKIILLLIHSFAYIQILSATVFVIPKPIPFNSTGSALCGDLLLNFSLPDSLQKGYNADVKIYADAKTRELKAEYTFIASEAKTLPSEISTNISDLFFPIVEFKSDEMVWNYSITIAVNASLTKNELSFSPYLACKAITSECGSVKYTEKEIRFATDCGPSGKPYSLKGILSHYC